MPHILYDPKSTGATSSVGDKDYGYEYPEGMDLKPGSKLHDFIKNEILRRAQESRNEMKKRFDSWNEIDEVLTAYVKLSAKEKEVRKKDTKIPSTKRPVSIVFPYTYTILETILTYLCLAFMQDPIFRYEGFSPEDTIGAILLEKVIELHCNKTKVALNLHTMNRDGVAYGVGACAPMWKERWGYRTRKVVSDNIFAEEFERRVTEELLFEGNALENIDPYYLLPDPNVPIQRIQDGGFIGWVDIDNYMGLLDEEYSDPDMFNVKYLQHLVGRRSQYATKESKRQEFIGGTTEAEPSITRRTDVINMYINIIPREWKIGTGERPEKWFFSLGADEIVIRAKPLGLDHDLYPIVICAPEFDGYSITPISRLEILKGLQGVMDWMFNSHVANVRKAINDMLVVDPYLINMADLKDPEPGKLIRMRRPAWGRGVNDAVNQLTVSDVTQGNVKDTAIIMQWMQKLGGADESMGGSLRRGGPERLTKGEFQGTRAGGINRMERLARIIGVQGMQDLGYMFGSHTQQLMSQETYVKTVGRFQEALAKEFGPETKRLKVTPFDILIDYDVLVRDGTVPGGNFNEAWVNLFGVIGDHPELQQRLDVFRIFAWIARSLGAKNVHEFERIETTTLPPEQVQEGVRKGDLVPITGGR